MGHGLQSLPGHHTVPDTKRDRMVDQGLYPDLFYYKIYIYK